MRKSVSETSRLPNRPIHPYWLSGACLGASCCWLTYSLLCVMEPTAVGGRAAAAGFFPKDGEGNSLAMMVVNGKTWPRVVGGPPRVLVAVVYHHVLLPPAAFQSPPLMPSWLLLQTVARSAYRLRLLNGCNSRTLKISFRCGRCRRHPVAAVMRDAGAG